MLKNVKSFISEDKDIVERLEENLLEDCLARAGQCPAPIFVCERSQPGMGCIAVHNLTEWAGGKKAVKQLGSVGSSCSRLTLKELEKNI